MKRVLFSSPFAFLITVLLCGPGQLKASNKPETLLKQQSSKTGFIENKGQIIDQNNKPNPAVLYLLNTPGMNVQIRRGGFSYDLYKFSSPTAQSYANRGSVPEDRESSIQHPASSIQFHRIDLDLVNANPHPEIETSSPSSDYLNYYTTGTPVDGITNIHSYSTVTYKNIYPEIDLEFTLTDSSRFKYNFIVYPGGHMEDIRMKIFGPSSIGITDGNLVMMTSLGEIREHIPESYFRNKNGRTGITVVFRKNKSGDYGFCSSPAIPEQATLCIDPIPGRLWGTYFGGTSGDSFNKCRLDQNGYLYLTGSSSSATNIATSGAFQTTLGGNEDAILVKFTRTGQRVWATYFGGTEMDQASGLAIDLDSSIYIAGYTYSDSSIATPGSFQEVFGGTDEDAFLAKFNSSGQRKWSTYYGGNCFTWGGRVSVDNNGFVYLCGESCSASGISTPGSHQEDLAGLTDGFLAKFTVNGQRVWATYYGGNCQDACIDVSADASGNVIVLGRACSANNISTPGSWQPGIGNPPCSQTEDAFLVRFNSAGVRQWGTYYGGSGIEYPTCVTLTSDGFIYFTGNTRSPNNMASAGSYQPLISGMADDFLAKFNLGGSRVWGTYYGGTDWESDGGECQADDSANVFLCGTTRSTTNISTSNAYQTMNRSTSTWGDNAFLVKFNGSGERQWATYYGDTVFSGMNSISIIADTIYACGLTEDNRRVATTGAYQTSLAGSYDAMIVKFEDCFFPDTTTMIFGPNSLCAPMTAVYNCASVSNATGYSWTSPPGSTIISGQNSTSVTIDFGVNAISGPVTVSGVNNCGAGEPKSFFVLVGTTANPTLGGSDTVCSGSSMTYTTETGKAQYYWAVTGGIVTGGGSLTDDFVTNLWTTPGSFSVFISYTDSLGCNSNTYELPVLVQTDMPASVTISASPDPDCGGLPVTITAIPFHGGITPSYQWKVNGGDAGTNNPLYTYTPLNGDLVTCTMTSSESCATGNPATSAPLLMTVNPDLPVDVTISSDTNGICASSLVTFTANPTNPGSSPVYQWKVNGVNSGTNSTTFSYTPLNGDVVTCVLTSSLTICISNNPATSNGITMTVNPNLPVSVTVTPTQNPVCAGTTVTFTAFPLNEGTTPSYQWKVNGTSGGANLSTYTYIPLNGDGVTCTVNSNATCAINNPATSAPVTMTVNPDLPVSISITSSANPYCAGSSVTFTATPNNGGTPPSCQWKVNGIGVGPDNQVYSYFPNNGDVVTCVLNSNIACPIGNPATSNAITMIVNSNLPAGVSITTTSNPFCPGLSVTFTATPSNGGLNPAYQWKVNGNNVGINSSTYTYNPVNNDSIRCVMTSNLSCVTGNPASSAKIIMSGTLAPIVSFTSCFDTITTINAKPIKLKGGIPLNGVYSGPGVNSLTGIFTPALAGVGTHTITYTYTNVAMCSALAHTHIINYPLSIVNCGNPLTDVRDNKVYQTIQIGTQCWLATNLNFGTILASSQDQRDNCIAEKYCYNDNPINCTNHGGLYQWDELMLFDETPADQGFCPPGWHIPTENEWNVLFASYINSGFAGSPLKYSGYSGFNALLSGARHIDRNWDFQGFATFFWSSTLLGSTKAWAHGMNDPDPSVSIYPASRVNAFSVRCLKD